MHRLKSGRLPKVDSWLFNIHTHLRLRSLRSKGTRDSVHSLLSVRKVLASDAFLQNFPSHVQSTFANTRLSKSRNIGPPEYLAFVKRFYLARKVSLPKRQLVTMWGLWTTMRYTSAIWANSMVYLAYKSLSEEKSEAVKALTTGAGEKSEVVSIKVAH
jgi:hypothetical protein